MDKNDCPSAVSGGHPWDDERSAYGVTPDSIEVTTPCDVCDAVRTQVFDFEKIDDGLVPDNGCEHAWGPVQDGVNSGSESGGKEYLWTHQFCTKCEGAMRSHHYVLADETIQMAA